MISVYYVVYDANKDFQSVSNNDLSGDDSDAGIPARPAGQPDCGRQEGLGLELVEDADALAGSLGKGNRVCSVKMKNQGEKGHCESGRGGVGGGRMKYLATIAVDAERGGPLLTGDDKIQDRRKPPIYRRCRVGQGKARDSNLNDSGNRLCIGTALQTRGRRHSAQVDFTVDHSQRGHAGAPIVIVEALQFYRAKNSDFGDALLCAFAR